MTPSSLPPPSPHLTSPRPAAPGEVAPAPLQLGDVDPDSPFPWAKARGQPQAWMSLHNKYAEAVAAAKAGGGLDLLFYGDSITEAFRATQLGWLHPRAPPENQDVFNKYWGSRYRADVLAISGEDWDL